MLTTPSANGGVQTLRFDAADIRLPGSIKDTAPPSHLSSQSPGDRVGIGMRVYHVAGQPEIARRLIRKLPEVLEFHRVTGAESFMVQVAVRDVMHMEEVIDAMMPYVATNTSMILTSPVPWNGILPAVRYAKNGQSRKTPPA